MRELFKPLSFVFALVWASVASAHPITYELIARVNEAGATAKVVDAFTLKDRDPAAGDGIVKKPAVGTRNSTGNHTNYVYRSALYSDAQGDHSASMSTTTESKMSPLADPKLTFESSLEWDAYLETEGTGDIKCETENISTDNNNVIVRCLQHADYTPKGSMVFKARETITSGGTPARAVKLSATFSNLKVEMEWNDTVGYWDITYSVFQSGAGWSVYAELSTDPNDGFDMDYSVPIDGAGLMQNFIIQTSVVDSSLISKADNSGMSGTHKVTDVGYTASVTLKDVEFIENE